MSRCGAFIISLDFELHWGVFDHTALDERSRAYFDRTRALIPPTLRLFEEYALNASWATVGMLFARDREELLSSLPQRRPRYTDARLDPYRVLEGVGEDEAADPYHYAPTLIALIHATPGQVIGSHTFAHYYCLEAGQQVEAFSDDLQAAQHLMQRTGYGSARALVFPRNQYRHDYFAAVRRAGFETFRGNPTQWFWNVRSGEHTGRLQRVARLSDNYLSGWGDTTFDGRLANTAGVIEVPASRFLRPYLSHLDGYGGQRLKLRRILSEMQTAARQARSYHLWWHPHNLATHPQKNMDALREIAHHYQTLQRTYGWESHSMESFVDRTARMAR
ncbi:polysaccharide deacetylase [Neolewinella sp.]|uniref:polysaccharide deacetylase n=1 Tax=Neolewinella sp. TaxID=2993543 RepID=UPI003B51C4BA